MSTEKQFDAVIEHCKNIFIKKTIDYGTAWRVLRTISVVDQIFIKALRIRNIQNLQQQKVEFVRLTGTILRAQQAVTVGIGILRSFL